MKRVYSIALVILMAATLFACSASSEEATVLILADVQEEGHPTAMACDRFAELVKEKTDGRIIIETYHGSTLGTEEEHIEQTMTGAIDFARVSSPLAKLGDTDLNAFQALYLYKDEEHMWNVLNGSFGQKFLTSDNLADKGLVGLTWYSGGSRNFYNSKKEITSPEDLEGMAIRVNTNSMIGFLNAVGCTPKNVSFNDIYSSLESGELDGAENNWPSYISTGHYKIAKYITVDEHTRVPEMIIASTKTMSKLSEEDQKIIKECAVESMDYQIKQMKKFEEEAIKTAEKAGCTITYLTEEQVKVFQKASEPVNNEVSAEYMDIIDEIKRIQ